MAGLDINFASGDDIARDMDLDVDLSATLDAALDAALAWDFSPLPAAVLVADFPAIAALAAALRVMKAAVAGRAPRVVAAATRRADFDAGFLACVRALLCALAPLVAFLALRRDALAGRRAVLVDCVRMNTI